jgi:hypothetical protein
MAVATSDSNLSVSAHWGIQSGGASTIGGSAKAESKAFDTVTLAPPADYTYLTIVATMIDNVNVKSIPGNPKGSVIVEWDIPGVLHHSTTVTTNDSFTIDLTPTISRPDLSSPFRFTITKEITATATTKPTIPQAFEYSSFGLPWVNLPRKDGSWSCTWASGRKCP